MFYDFNGNGVQEAFALVDVGGRKEIWYNGEDSTSNAVEIFPITDVASCSVNAIANAGQNTFEVYEVDRRRTL